MKKLRLLITDKCPRSCAGCCNKDWDLNALPICTDFSGYDEIMLTGGEPMLYPDLVNRVLYEIARVNPDALTIMYTARLSSPKDTSNLYYMLHKLGGITVTLHEQSDVYAFALFNLYLATEDRVKKSLRLNVFKGIELPSLDLTGWQIKDNIVWLKDCPLPQDEVFMRYN